MKHLLKADFIHDYNHFRDFGFSNREIAARFGFEVYYLRRRARKYGVYRPEPYEAQAAKVFDRLVASGEPFALECLPVSADESVGHSLIRDARVHRRLRRIGERKSSCNLGAQVSVYVGVAA